MPSSLDDEIRAAAIEQVRRLRDSYGGRIPRHALMEGITVGGQRIPIWNYQEGIFKPAVFGRGTDPDNAALRRAMLEQRPLIYLVAVDPGFYDAVLPVYVAGDDPLSHQFTLLADQLTVSPVAGDPVMTAARREYATWATS